MTSRRTRPLNLALVATLAATGLAGSGAGLAQTAIYCCNDASNRKVCADFLPPECAKRAYEERDDKGYVIKKHEAPLTPEQIAQREAEAAKKAELERQKLEQRRRELALLTTYADEKDIDRARDAEMATFDKLIGQAEKALTDAKARQAKVAKEKEFYKDKALPGQLKEQLATAEKDVAAKQKAVDERQADKAKAIARFEDEKKKYRELKTGKTIEPEKPKREIVIQANEGAAGETRSSAPAAEAGSETPPQTPPAAAPTAAAPAAKPAGK